MTERRKRVETTNGTDKVFADICFVDGGLLYFQDKGDDGWITVKTYNMDYVVSFEEA